jgi:hypothetical protein
MHILVGESMKGSIFPSVRMGNAMKRSVVILALLTCLPITVAMAAGNGPTPAQCAFMPKKKIRADMLQGIFSSHADLFWRSVALGHYRKKKFAKALEDFKRAAHYGDKFSQSMVAMMYWKAQGTKADRALAYAWIDLAAERGYHNFLQQREWYWAMLDDAEREDAIQRGQAIYAEYSDEVAKPRMQRDLERSMAKSMFSRPGLGRSAMFNINGGIPAQIYYSDDYYDVEQYWCTQDAYWSRPLNPEVNVGDLEQVRDVIDNISTKPKK